jgi:glycine/D-amino acid oxidase-like deaminating enzyme
VVEPVTAAPLDLVVVGGGIVGATVAAEARRRRPAARVLLLDRDLTGSGATRYSAALCPPVGATPEHRRMVARAERWYADLERAGGLARRWPDTFWVVRESSLVEFHKAFVDRCPLVAGHADRARLAEAYPDLVVRPDEVVLHSTGTWAADAEATARTLAARLARADGCGCWEGVRVDDVQPEGAHLVLLTGTGHRIPARHVVLATGAWLAEDPGAARAGLALRVKRIAALHLARRPRPEDPVVDLWDDDAFLLPLPDRGVTLFSFYCPTWHVRPGRGAAGLDGEDLRAALAVLAARSPRLAGAVAGGRAFCDGYLPARLPAVAADPARPGVALAGGCSGSGFRLAPALAEQALSTLDGFGEG